MPFTLMKLVIMSSYLVILKVFSYKISHYSLELLNVLLINVFSMNQYDWLHKVYIVQFLFVYFSFLFNFLTGMCWWQGFVGYFTNSSHIKQQQFYYSKSRLFWSCWTCSGCYSWCKHKYYLCNSWFHFVVWNKTL